MKLTTGDLFFEATVMEVKDSEEGKTGWVDIHGVRVQINLSLVPEARSGDRVAVEGRFAVAVLEDRNEVRR